jgi:hypothetical protein
MIERNGGASLSLEARFQVAGSVWQIASNARKNQPGSRERAIVATLKTI